MSEIQLILLFCLKIGLVVSCGVLHRLGGSDIAPLAVRRIGIPILLCLGLSFFNGWTEQMWMWICGGLLFAALSFGYGHSFHGGSTFKKVLARLLQGSFYALAFIPLAIVTGNVDVFFNQLGINLILFPIMGVLNPTSATNEEMILGTCGIAGTVLYVSS